MSVNVTGIQVYAPSPSAGGVGNSWTDLIADPDAWSTLRPGVSSIKITTQAILWSSDDDLKALFSFLKQHGISLAVEALAIPSGPGATGSGIEGYSAPGTMAAIAQRVARLGGSIDLVAMDEPLYFGHQFSGPTAAHETIANLAKEVAASLAPVKELFPNVAIGDIEPIPSTKGIKAWAAAFEKASGAPLAFLDADVDWNSKWQTPLANLSRTLSAQGIPLGLIVDGLATATTGAQWDAEAIHNLAQAANMPNVDLRELVVQSWMPEPNQILPETALGSLTNLALIASGILGGAEANSAALVTSATPSLDPPDRAWMAGGSRVSLSSLGLEMPAGNPSGSFTLAVSADNGTLALGPQAGGTLFLRGNWTQIASQFLATTLGVGSATQTHLEVVLFFDGSVVSEKEVTVVIGANTLTPSSAGDVAAQVGCLYEQVLNRDPDPNGLASWVRGVENGLPLSAVRHAFAYSGEVVGLLTLASRGVLNRNPTKAELSTMEQQLNAGSTWEQVTASLHSRAEREVAQAYQLTQNRAADPQGLNSFVDYMMDGHSISEIDKILATSGESSGRLSGMYQQQFGAPPSEAELAELEQMLTLGVSAKDLMTVIPSLNSEVEVYNLTSDILGDGPELINFIIASAGITTLPLHQSTTGFVFAGTPLSDIEVRNFDVRHDILGLSAAIASPSAGSIPTMEQSDRGTLIDLTNGSHILLSGVRAEDVTGKNFNIY